MIVDDDEKGVYGDCDESTTASCQAWMVESHDDKIVNVERSVVCDVDDVEKLDGGCWDVKVHP